MAAMSVNTKLALTSINTSGNVIEEKGCLRIFHETDYNTFILLPNCVLLFKKLLSILYCYH